MRLLAKSWNFPRYLKLDETEILIPSHSWQTMSYLGTATMENGRLFYEKEDIRNFRRKLAGKKCFFDVGAQIGWYSFVAQAAGVERTYAFEILKPYASFAKRIAALNNVHNIRIFNQGVGAEGKIVEFTDSLGGKCRQAVRSLDSLALELNAYPDVMKVDIEGNEVDLLKGAEKVLSSRPYLILSVHPPFLTARGQKESDVFDILKSYGYTIESYKGGTLFAS